MKNVSATSSTVAYNAYSWDGETDIYPSVYYRYGFEESGNYIPTAQPPYHYQENLLYPVFWNRYYGVAYHYWTTTTSGTSAKLVVQQNYKRYYGFQWLTQGLPVRCVKIQ